MKPTKATSNNTTSSSSSGNNTTTAKSTRPTNEKQQELVYTSAMAVATAPGKQLLMTGFMLWMSGNSLQIFSIMMLFMALSQPLQKLFQVGKEFARYESSSVDITIPKLTFIACNLAGVALALYKANTMGLLPTSTADWVSSDIRHSDMASFSGSVTSMPYGR